MKNKKVERSTIIGSILLLAALLITGLFGVSSLMNGGTETLHGHPFTYGLKVSIKYFFQLWRPETFAHETCYIGLVLVLVAIVVTIAFLYLSISRKRYFFVIPTLMLGAAMAFLPFIFILVVPMVQLGVMKVLPMIFMAIVTGLTLFAIFFLGFACSDLLKESVDALKKMAGEEEDDFEEKPVQREGVNGLSEEEVKAIVEKYLAEHVEEKHSDEPAPAPAPQPEPEPEEEPEEEPEAEEEEAPADDSANALGFNGKRRRASFETRLKNSEYDIRHKYYDLRDYIKWYGLRNRISIPGDTFSYKRQRYVFVTIVGKHIRVYIGLNPADYADSTIPVEAPEAKKYEDLPCMLRVKSDLSYRRAKKLVDDLMQKIGIERPEGEEPKETQEQ